MPIIPDWNLDRSAMIKHFKNNDDLIDEVKRKLGGQGKFSPEIETAMRRVDRRTFIPPIFETVEITAEEYIEQIKDIFRKMYGDDKSKIESIQLGKTVKVPAQDKAYLDEAIFIGYKQTCSQPSMVASICHYLDLSPGMRVLELGTGCGYHAAIVSEILGKKGVIVTAERIPQLAHIAQQNLKAHFGSEYDQRIIQLKGDISLGAERLGVASGFDRIYFAASVSKGFDASPFVKEMSPERAIMIYPQRINDSYPGLGDNLIRRIMIDGNEIGIPEVLECVRFVPVVGKNR